ncbi:MAG: efflux RND transporter permease subunit, partial [Myxococcota bacterium]|nr:efflux RND transporter permease subunit [Myxococcota bacterium]
ALVRRGHADREVVTRLDGREAVELEIYKTADANLVTVARRVRNRLGVDENRDDGKERGGGRSLTSQLPDGVVMVPLQDQARFVEASLSNLRSTVVLGGVLAVIVLFAFLGSFRATAIIATAIPLSIVCTFAPMHLGEVSLNLMSLGGLALGIGMLVDNAVVVLENIHVHLERGVDRVRAAVVGTQEVAMAVVASTLTTISVFLPLSFVEGVAGQVFGDLAMAVVFSLLASLVVALFFVPMLAALSPQLTESAPRLRDVARSSQFRSIAQLREAWGSRTGVSRWSRLPYWLARFMMRLVLDLLGSLCALTAWPLRLVAALGKSLAPWPTRVALAGAERFQRGFQWCARLYGGWLDQALGRPWATVAIAMLCVGVSLPVWPALGRTLIPELHQGRFTVDLSLPVGTPLAQTLRVAEEGEERLSGHPQVAHVHAVVGSERRADSRPDEGEHTARLGIELTPGGDLRKRQQQVKMEARELLSDLGAEIRLSSPSLFTFRTPVEVVLFGRDLDHLRDVADRVRQTLGSLPGLRDVGSSLTSGFPEIRVRYDRLLLDRHGLDTRTVAERVRVKIQGELATTLGQTEGRTDLVVRLLEQQRRGLEELRRINVNPELVPTIPLEAVAILEEGEGPS